MIRISILIAALATPASAQQIVAGSEGAVSVQHMRLTRGKATSLAMQHCARYGKVAVLISRNREGIGQWISSYRCE